MPTSINEAEVLAMFEAARVPRTKRVLVGSDRVEFPIPFPSPEDWRDQWIYFLMVDRFNNPQIAPQPTSVPFDGLVGEFRGGVAQRLCPVRSGESIRRVSRRSRRLASRSNAYASCSI